MAAGVLLVLASLATPAHAQFRGRLTSRPAPVTVPRMPTFPSRAGVPVWWPWGVVLLPDTTSLSSPLLPADAPPGGVQLDVQPWSALVYVDGERKGRVEEFRGYYQHLEIPAGAHTIAIVTPGREPRAFDVVVIPGKTITYRTTLHR
jgi:hypothetical protein